MLRHNHIIKTVNWDVRKCIFSFYGSKVNITALPFPPYWNAAEKTTNNGESMIEYSGTDYQMIHAISQALNFTINVLPSADWDEVNI